MPDRPIVFLDLDDTLFSSWRKSPGDLALFEAVAYDRAGAPLSYMSARQRAFFEWLRRDAAIVPTTGRNLDAYRRVRLPFAGHAILSHGGVIVDAAGVPDAGWHGQIAGQAADCRDTLHALCNRILAETAGVDLRARPISDGGVDLYGSVKHNGEDAAALAAVAPQIRALLPAGWTLHLNANNLAVMPPFVSKAAAVRYFLDTLAGDPAFVVGIGDSLSDLPFLALADLAMLPTRSQAFLAITEAIDGP